ncbi:hypothetical protein KAR91_03150 [Candidatus Pacearchaeota archaeon]|nr:hypothetical protein [Candidatus Pacearchaeota archaeon]
MTTNNLEKSQPDEYVVGDLEKMTELVKETINILQVDSKKRGVDISSILEKLSQENRIEEVYRLTTEAISKLY